MVFEGKQKYIIQIILIGISLFIVAFFAESRKVGNGKLQAVFCNVGQGDAIYLKTPKGSDILIDGGPDEKVLQCLAGRMPFWDKTLELVVVSHPQADHITGLIPVFNRYRIKNIILGSGNKMLTSEFVELKKIIKEQNITTKYPLSGQKIEFEDGVTIDILWPEKKWLADRLFDQNGRILGASVGSLSNSHQKYVFNGDLNSSSLILLVKYHNFKVLLTGDADNKVQELMLKNANFFQVDVLKVPHHGSKNALLDDFLIKIDPKIAIISVGKNSFGHPSKEIETKFYQKKIRLMRTDKEGEIGIESTGSGFAIM